MPTVADVWAAADALFPVRVTRSWWTRALASERGEALLRQVLPSAAELQPVPGDLRDPVGDARHSPVPWVVRKYDDRVLLMLTKRCHLYCRYCFRRTFDPTEAEDPTEDEWEAALDYAVGCGATEAILSGGDPLAAHPDRLRHTLRRLTEGGLQTIRMHSRAPITAPSRVTPDLVSQLRTHRVWLVVHTNHPDELSADVDEALARLVDGGVPVLNQAVLLRGVNDDVDVLVELMRALVQRRVKPYYLHHPDAVTGNGAFRVSLAEGLALVEALRARVSGLAMPRYVIDPPDGGGKVEVAAWVAAGERRA